MAKAAKAQAASAATSAAGAIFKKQGRTCKQVCAKQVRALFPNDPSTMSEAQLKQAVSAGKSGAHYAKIKTKKRVAELWAERLVAEGVVSQEEVERQAQEVWDNLTLLHQRLKAKIAAATEHETKEHSTGEYQLDRSPSPDVDTAVPAARLRELGEELLRTPEGFTVHPKLVKQLERRREALAEDNPPVAIDCCAEFAVFLTSKRDDNFVTRTQHVVVL